MLENITTLKDTTGEELSWKHRRNNLCTPKGAAGSPRASVTTLDNNRVKETHGDFKPKFYMALSPLL